MKGNQFKTLVKEKTPKEIIYSHIHGNLFLTNKQLEQIINLKNGVKK